MSKKSAKPRKTVADFPELVKQWHPTKNGEIKPNQISYGSTIKIWWICERGPDHEWEASVNNRTSKGRGCPFCSGKRVSLTNSLATLFPEIAKEWHPTKNGSLKPEQVVSGTHRKAWWICEKGPDHEWEASIKSRTQQKTR